MVKELFKGIYSIDNRICTRNLVNGNKVYNEMLITIDGIEYRSWNPYRSKLSAAVINGLKHFGIKEGDDVLYLGASTGTTASHVSDVVGENGHVYCVEFSERSMQNLLEVCEKRKNMLPVLADAREPEKYLGMVGKVDALYQDVSAREQADIFIANSAALKKGGYAYFVIKSQSIDISKAPNEVYKEVLGKLKDGFEVLEQMSLEPFDSAHLFVVLRKK